MVKRYGALLPSAVAVVALGSACAVYDPSLLVPADGGSEACTATCGGACVDLATDPKNCGACGKTCSAGCTAGLCDADVLATDRAAPHAIVVDDTQAYFTEFNSVQVTSVDKATGQNLSVVSGQAVYPEGIAIDPSFVYFTNSNDLLGSIGRSPKAGNGQMTVLGKSLPTPTAITLDGSGNVYVTTQTNNKATGCLPTSYASSVMRCPSTGCFVPTGCPTSGGLEVVFTDNAVPTAIAVSQTTIFAVSRVGKWLKSCSLPACADLAGFTGTFGGPTDVVATSEGVYVADADGGAIVRCDRTSKSCSAIATGIDQPWRLATDGTTLWFTAYGSAKKGAASVQSCALPSCSGGPKKLTAGTAFYGITVDAKAIYFTEEGSRGGTSLDGKVRRLAR